MATHTKKEFRSITFKNRTWEQIKESYLNLKTKYKSLQFPKAIRVNGLIEGEFAGFTN